MCMPCDWGAGGARPHQACKLSDRFNAIAIESSADWVAALASEFVKMRLLTLTYELVWRDGSLMWSKVTATNVEGSLAAPSQTKPLFEAELAERRRVQRLLRPSTILRAGDPLSGGSSSHRGRGHGPGRGGKGRGMARKPNRASASGMGPAEPAKGAPMSSGLVLQDMLEEPNIVAEGEAHAPATSEAPTDDEAEHNMLDLNNELEMLVEEDLDELRATYADGPHPSAQPAPLAQDGALAEAGAAQTIADALAEDACALGLEDEAVPDAETVGERSSAVGASGSSTDMPPPPPPPPEPSICDRMGVTGPSPMGYLSQDGRSFLRIQRGKPKGNISVKCYRHSGCSWLLTEKSAPPDDDIVAWAFEVPATTSSMGKEESKALAQQHMKLVDRWRPKKVAKAAAAKAACSNV